MSKIIDQRLPSTLPMDERVREIGRLIQIDPKLGKMAQRLEEIALSHDGAVLWAEAERTRAEVED